MKLKRGPRRNIPTKDCRFDAMSHWPEHKAAKRQCAHCRTRQSRIGCVKCKVTLCLSNHNNCFTEIHAANVLQDSDEPQNSDDSDE